MYAAAIWENLPGLAWFGSTRSLRMTTIKYLTTCGTMMESGGNFDAPGVVDKRMGGMRWL
jgi:hypothetical protein